MTPMFLLPLISALHPFAPEIVQNGLMPKGKPHSLVLQEELRIKSNLNQEYFNWYGRGLKVVPRADGHFFLVQPSENRIIHFDDKGYPLESFGRKGEGPGEFRRLKSYHIFENGKSIAFDYTGNYHAFSFYDVEGKFVERMDTPMKGVSINTVDFSPSGELFFASYRKLSSNHSVKISGVLTRDQKVLKTLTEVEAEPRRKAEPQKPEYWSELIAGGLKADWEDYGMAAFQPDGQIYLATASDYEITRWDPGLQTPVLKIQKEYKPVLLDDKMKEELMESLYDRIVGQTPAQFREMITPEVVKKGMELSNPPVTRHPLKQIQAIEDRGLLVFREIDPKANKVEVDLFLNNGVYVGSFDGDLGLARMVFLNGRAYTVETGEDEDDLFLVRYRYAIEPKH